MKLWKLHTLVFRCPCCGKGADYAAQIVSGRHKGSYWDPAYWCEQCSTAVRARDTWLFGAVFGPLMLITGIVAFDALTAAWASVPHAVALIFAAACCAIVGWPLSRGLSRHILYWEPRGPAALQRARVSSPHEDEE